MILQEHDPQVMKSAHGITTDEELCDILLDYAIQTLKVGG